MLRDMKMCRILLYLRSLSKNCLVFVCPESRVSWTGKNWKAYSVLQRQGTHPVCGQTWAVSTPLAPWAACRPWGALSIGRMQYLLCISIMNAVRMSLFMGIIFFLSPVQFRSLAQLCPTLCDPMNRRTPGLPVDHQLPESTQTHVHCVGDAILPSHPPSSPSPPSLHCSQHQGLFQWVSSSHEVAKVLEFQLQHQSFQWTPRTDLL